MLDLEFINSVNGMIACVSCAILYDPLQALWARVHHEHLDFKPDGVGGRSPGMSSFLSFYSYD